MIARLFHAWERRLAAVTQDRVVRPFEWGLEWIPTNGHGPNADPDAVVSRWAEAALADSDGFFANPPGARYTLEGNLLTFPSAIVTPHAENNAVCARYFPAANGTRRSSKSGAQWPGPTSQGEQQEFTPVDKSRRAVLVMAQWNARSEEHLALCRILQRLGISALRLSLPYHDQRMPPELHRADYIVSANVARTLQVCRQAVVDARRAIAWLSEQGYDRIGILGTSLGSCLAMLTAAHEPKVQAQALNHISPYFADVVWEGLSCAHVRRGLEGKIDLERLRRFWLPISPQSYLHRIGRLKTLLVYAKYDLTFPEAFSRALVGEFVSRAIPHELVVLPCGHYTSGKAPFKYLDGFALTRFLHRHL